MSHASLKADDGVLLRPVHCRYISSAASDISRPNTAERQLFHAPHAVRFENVPPNNAGSDMVSMMFTMLLQTAAVLWRSLACMPGPRRFRPALPRVLVSRSAWPQRCP